MPFGVDKIIHVCEFGLLAWLLWRPWRETLPLWAEGKTAAFVLILTALNGLGDELHQLFLPHRTATWGDLAADVAGGGAAVWWCLHREKGRPSAVKLQ
jgi:VanZ family protein